MAVVSLILKLLATVAIINMYGALALGYQRFYIAANVSFVISFFLVMLAVWV